MRTKVNTAGVFLAVFLLIAAATAIAGNSAYVTVHQSVSPTTIYLAGQGSPDTASITLTVTGSGPQGGFPIDCMFVIDVSATADLNQTKQTAFSILAQLGKDDRAGVVVFSSQARLLVPLTGDITRVKQAIANLTRGGKSALGDALGMARQELAAHARPNAVLADILLTDGQNNVGSDPKVEGKMAAGLGIKIITVGIGYLIDRDLLERFADETGGLFFPHPGSGVAKSILNRLAVQQAATNIAIAKVLPADVRYVSADPRPTQIVSHPDGTTTLMWKIGALGVSAQWNATVNVQATTAGSVDTDTGSVVTYTDFRGVNDSIAIASRKLTVIVPNKPPIAALNFAPVTPFTKDTVQFTDKSSDPDGKVVGWKWNFGDGTTSTDQNPQHRYVRPGTYTVTLTVTDDRGAQSVPVSVVIKVKNTPPTALFTVDPKEPRSGVEANFDASGSNDLDGNIVSYAWDFNGDGVIDKMTTTPQISYAFPNAGKVHVTLIVTDNEGATGAYTRTLTVLPSVSVTRAINTCLPDDETIAGGKVKVTVTITANTIVNGLSLEEVIPQSWSFTAVDNGHATLHTWQPQGKSAGNLRCDWLFMETLKDGDKRVISYTLTAPTAPQFGNCDQLQVAINGTVGSSSPRLTQMVLGEDKITLVRYLPVPVVISRWDTQNNKIDLCLSPQISFDQIQYAVSLWISGNPVPYTDNAKVDLGMMRDLIAYWLTDTSVHDSLP